MLSRTAGQLLRRPPPTFTRTATSVLRQPPAAFGIRFYAWTRNPDRTSRIYRPKPQPFATGQPGPKIEPASQVVIEQNESLLGSNPNSGGLEKLLENDVLVVTRQIEMLNLFMGYEVANRYAINDVHGNVVGFIAEEERSFMGTVARQLFRTHRAFRSVVMDASGTPVLHLRRPFSFINSRLFVQRNLSEWDTKTGTEITSLVTFGEAKQEWHPWRRKYHLFHGGEAARSEFRQFAQVDSPFLAWDFFLQNEGDVNLASIRKGWTGLGREFFTDTSQYTIRFTPDPEAPGVQTHDDGSPVVYQPLSLEQRALVLALSVDIDFDYFSRHSEGPGLGLGVLWALVASTE